MGRTACTEPQWLYKGGLYLFYLFYKLGVSWYISLPYIAFAWSYKGSVKATFHTDTAVSVCLSGITKHIYICSSAKSEWKAVSRNEKGLRIHQANKRREGNWNKVPRILGLDTSRMCSTSSSDLLISG